VDGFLAVGVDPVTTRIRWRRSLQKQLEAIRQVTNGFVLLARAGDPPATGVDPTELFAIGADGRPRAIVLDRIRSGVPDYTRSPPSTEFRQPGLAFDGAGGKAYVVGAVEPIAEVDLTSMTVTYHGGSRTPAKAVSGPQRSAVWVGNGFIAVTGVDAGIALVDTRDWSWKTIDRDATAVTVAGGALLASAWIYDSDGPAMTGMGVTGYSLDGTSRLHILGRSVVDTAPSWGGLVYAIHDGVSVIDPASGRLVGTVSRSDVYPLTAE
jgi:hypothetical protein